MNKIILIFTHLLFAAAGFALGIYALPILTAPKAPTSEAMQQASQNVKFTGEFRKDLKGSDFLHWGEGKVSISDGFVSLDGKVAPGPDYKLYLSPTFVEDEASFEMHKASMLQIGDIKTFKNFIVPVPANTDLNKYTTAIVWCESFGEFITAAEYQKL